MQASPLESNNDTNELKTCKIFKDKNEVNMILKVMSPVKTRLMSAFVFCHRF